MIEIQPVDKTFISWLNKILEKPYYYDIPDIKFFAYSYYRSYSYKNLDAFNILKGIMAAFEISLEWKKKENIKDFINKYEKKQRIYLKRHNYKFLFYLKNQNDLFQRINTDIIKNHYNNSVSKEALFDIISKSYREELVENFKTYIHHSEYLWSINVNEEELITTLNEVINFNENFDSHLIMNRTDSVVGSMLEYITLTNKKTDYYNTFNFFSFLRKNKVDIHLSKKSLNEEIKMYCEFYNIKLDYQAKQNLMKNFYGTTFSIKIFDFFKGNNKNYFLSYKRYLNVFSHGVMLLKNDTDFSFLKSKSWDAFQQVTSNVIDIYYFKQELAGEMSGYSVLSKFENLKISIDNLPALLVWKDNIEDYRLIKFEDLDKELYLDIVVKYVSHVQNKKQLNENENENEIFEQAVNEARVEVLNKRKRDFSMTYQNINHGTQQGNFGHNGEIKNTHLTINNALSEKDVNIDSIAIKELKEVIEETLKLEIKGLETSEKMQITLELQKLVESFEREDTKEEDKQRELGKWKQFLINNNQKVLLVMGAVADVITLSTPLLKLLGIGMK